MLEKLSYEKAEAIRTIKSSLIDLYAHLGFEYKIENTEELRNGLINSSKSELNELLEINNLLDSIKELIIQ